MQKLHPVAEARIWLENWTSEVLSSEPGYPQLLGHKAYTAAVHAQTVLEYVRQLEKELAEKTDILKRGGV